MSKFEKIDDGLYGLELTDDEREKSLEKAKKYKEENEDDSFLERIKNNLFK